MPIQPAKNTKPVAANNYVPVKFTAPGEKPVTISFTKGTDIAIDEKSHNVKKPVGIKLDKAHYEALLKADVNHDHKIDKKDAQEYLSTKKNPNHVSATPFGVNVPSNPKNVEDGHRVGVFMPGYIHYNQTHPEED